jgi:hypothetical protein
LLPQHVTPTLFKYCQQTNITSSGFPDVVSITLCYY